MIKKVISHAIAALKTEYPIEISEAQTTELLQSIKQLQKNITIRARSYDGKRYNLSVECKTEADAQSLQGSVQTYLNTSGIPLKATSVGNYVDIMSCPNGFFGKGVALFQVFQFHPTIPKQNIYIIDDSTHKGGNGVPMMVDDQCQCFSVGPKQPELPHIQTKIQDQDIMGQYAEGTAKILATIQEKINRYQVAGNEIILLLDVDATLTMKGRPDEHMAITDRIQAQLIELMGHGVHIYFCTARGIDLLDIQSDFFQKIPGLNLGIFQMNGTHYISGRDISAHTQTANGKRDFSAITSKYEKADLYTAEL